MKVFIAGPRAVNTLNEKITDVLSRVIEKHLTVLLGDANGVDRLVQEYFAREKYLSVYVYACNGNPRNNIGGWTVQNVEVPAGTKGFDFYSKKDICMAQDADSGFMIWNGKSKGTFNNIINLASQNKRTIIYYIPARKMLCLNTLLDVERFSKSVGSETYSLFRKLCPQGAIPIKNESYEQLTLFEMF